MEKNQSRKKLVARFKEDPYMRERQERLGDRMKKFTEASQEEDAKGTAKLSHLPYISLTGYPIDKEVLKFVPEEIAKISETVPFYFDEDKKDIKIGVLDPYSEAAAKVIADLRGRGFSVTPYIISPRSLRSAHQLYRLLYAVKKEKRGEIGVSEEEYEKISEEIKNLADLKKALEEAPVSNVINIIVAGAVITDSSDIHMEPEENDVKMRYRIDGVLQDVAAMSSEQYQKVVGRIKLLAGLKININNIPQDGRFAIDLGKKKIDLRVSILPTGYGETIVIRLLGTGATGLKIDQLGFSERDMKILMEKIKEPNGMILTTGPTGSGKTTTLYSFLNQIQSPDIKIITLENPIEYRLSGISQTQIDPSAGMTFAAALRSVLRQDPDVVMVGEIRDLETADIASQAALTGHIVFSTLHTNDSSGVIPRLINMGLRPFVIAPALKAVIAQRLVRRVCPKCRKEYIPDENLLASIKQDLGKYYPKQGIKKLYRASKQGCAACSNTGYRGRIGIYEVFEVDRKIKDLIDQRASAAEIMDAARAAGMTTMRQDGLRKAIAGITSVEEVRRVS